MKFENGRKIWYDKIGEYSNEKHIITGLLVKSWGHGMDLFWENSNMTNNQILKDMFTM